ncbi:MAG: MATE family efflux transporter [Clostridia bacterium]|nr:MATE family efflux transporter [Clostridia bacterium]
MDMTRGKPAGMMLKFALPVIVTNLGQQFYMIADAAIVGRGVGVDALAAVGCTDWTYWIILWSIQVMTQGFATFVSRYFGARDYARMNKCITMSTILSFLLAVLFTVAGTVFARPVLTLMDTPAAILDDAVTYLSTMAAGTIVVAGYNLSAAILRAFGDGKSPLHAMIIAAIMNLLLDVLFIMVFGWGVFGAALASVMSQTFAFVYCVIRILRVDCVRMDGDAWKMDGRLFVQLLLFGLPLAIQYIVINTGGTFIQAAVNLQGSAFVAGYTSVNKLYGILECSAIAMGAAFTTYASQNFGAGNFRRVREGVRTCNILAVVSACVVMIPVLLLRTYLPQLFIDVNETGAAEAIAVAARYLTNMAICLPFLYLIYVYRSNLQAIGDTVWSMISGFSETIARVGMARLIILWAGRDALFFTEPFAWFISWMTVMIPFYFYRRKRLPVVEEE